MNLVVDDFGLGGLPRHCWEGLVVDRLPTVDCYLGSMKHNNRKRRSELRVTPTPLFILFLNIFRVLSPWLGL